MNLITIISAIIGFAVGAIIGYLFIGALYYMLMSFGGKTPKDHPIIEEIQRLKE